MSHLGFSVHVAERKGGGTAVTVIGELDMSAAPELESAFEPAIAGGDDVTLDMRACSFVDSSGVATIVKAARRLHDEGRALTVEGAQERVRRIFELAGLLSEGWIVFADEPDE